VIFFEQKKSLLELNKIQELEIEQLKKELENIRSEFNEFKNLDMVPVDLPLKTTNDEDEDDFIQIDVAKLQPLPPQPVPRRVKELKPAKLSEILDIRTNTSIAVDTDSDEEHGFVDLQPPARKTQVPQNSDDWEVVSQVKSQFVNRKIIKSENEL
jgi:hypothetical protein